MDIAGKGTNKTGKTTLKSYLALESISLQQQNRTDGLKLNGQFLNINSKYRVVEPREFPVGGEGISRQLLITKYIFNLPLRKTKKKKGSRKEVWK